MESGFSEISERDALDELIAAYRKNPQAYLLKIELDLDDEQREEFRKYGEAENGMIREFLVPNTITLHSLHYLIMKAFGLKNTHERRFFLPSDIFERMTGGHLRTWMDFIGSYFRFPYGDIDRPDWHYEEKEAGAFETEKDYENWLSELYSGPYLYEGLNEQYIEQRLRVIHMTDDIRDLMKETGEDPGIPGDIPIEKGIGTIFDGNWDPNTLQERLRLRDVMMPLFREPDFRGFKLHYSHEQKLLDENMDMILENLSDAYDEFEKTAKALDEIEGNGVEYNNAYNEMALHCLEFYQRQADYSPKIAPVTNELHYSYGEWNFTITVLEEYWDRSEYDTSSSETLYDEDNSFMTDELVVEDHTEAVLDEQAARRVMDVSDTEVPLCTLCDGLDPVEDIGGTEDYLDFLRKLRELPQEEARELSEKAVDDGWTKILKKPNRIL